jgi:hypothetical protein
MDVRTPEVFLQLPPPDEAAAPESVAKRAFRRLRALLPAKRFASKSYRFLARQLAADVAPMQGTAKIVFSSVGELALGSEVLLMLAHFLQDEYDCNVLLMDGTFRKGGISDRLSVDGPLGFANFICGEHWKANPLITATVNKNIYLMPSGVMPPRPNQRLTTELIAARLKTASRGFRYVFVQQGCILDDSRYIGFNQLADVVLLHAEERQTKLEQVEACRRVYDDHLIRNVRLVLSE